MIKLLKSLRFYTATIIKPDAHEDILVENIIADIEYNGLLTVFRKDLVIRRDLARQIYHDNVHTQWHFAAVKSLMGNERCNISTLAVFKDSEGMAIKKMQVIKGQADLLGIRAKYRKFWSWELKQMGYEGEELRNILARNRLHVPNNTFDTLRLLQSTLSLYNWRCLEDREPRLIDFLRKGLIFKQNYMLESKQV